MIDALRMVRRASPGAGWRALALLVGPALLLAGTVLPTVVLQGRLPRYEVPPYQEHPLHYLFGAEVFAGWLVAAWAAVFVVSRTSRPPRRRLWERWLPLVYALGGLTMNMSYMLAGSAGVNPVLALAAGVLLVCRGSAGTLGFDGAVRRLISRSTRIAVRVPRVIRLRPQVSEGQRLLEAA